ncbi:MAG TPA: HlyD family efflux transporter periplasmic adaptor subunit [Burkholderiales bacterium]|nr:HlyD family efflux transporter periplasmic adaptor subunit [Burkholderiales bacterium]
MTRRNRILLGVALAVVAALVAWALQPRPVTVELARVVQGPFEQTVSDDGKTRVRDRYVISAPLAGRVERIRLEAGDGVKQGDVVALLTPTAPAFVDARTARELQERVGAAQAQLARARAETAKVLAQLDQARADLERQARLAQEGFVSSTAREQAALNVQVTERALDAARFAEEGARHELAQARAALARYESDKAGKAGEGSPPARWEVTSPVTGSVLKVIQKSEAAVPLGAPLIEVADARSLEAVVDILSQEAVVIRAGMPARLELGQGVEPLAGQVRLVEPAAFTKISALGVEEQRVNVIIDFAEPLDKVRTIGDGFRVDAHIITFRVPSAIKVPVGALFRDLEAGPDAWAVFVAEEGRARKRAVRTSRRNRSEALVESGLGPGEEVVVYPSETLRDGDKILAVQK